jgi:cytochrome c
MQIEETQVRHDLSIFRVTALVACAALLPAAMVQCCWADSAPLPTALIERHCNACHAVNDRLIGPPLLAVAARYGAAADRQRTMEVLTEKIRFGGGGNWGVVPMVPNTNLSVDEARSLVLQILSLKPSAE